MYKIVSLLILTFCLGCAQSKKGEIWQKSRDKVVNVQNRIKEISMDEVLISNNSRMCLLGDYLIVRDNKAVDKQIHLLDKNTFRYLTGAAYKGQGPEEITILGHIATDEAKRLFYVSDHGKLKIFKFHVDSVLSNPFYFPKEEIALRLEQFPDTYYLINDTLALARVIKPTSSSTFDQVIAKWNIRTNEMIPLEYIHPDIEQKRTNMAVDLLSHRYVEWHHRYDLISLFDLEGNLISHIYGPGWKKKKSGRDYFRKVVFGKEHLIALYSGKEAFVNNLHQGKSVNLPTQFLIFDKEGNYIQTLETSYQVSDFCYDQEKNRLLINFNDEIQFGYLDMEGLL